MIKKKFIVLFALCSIFCGLFGYWLGSKSTPVSANLESGNLMIGETAIIHHVEITYHGARIVPYEEDESQQYVIIDLSIKNNREQAYGLHLHKFTLVDRNYFSYEYELMDNPKALKGGQISSGRTMRGELAFLVPKDDEYELIFTDHVRTGQAIWTVKL